MNNSGHGVIDGDFEPLDENFNPLANLQDIQKSLHKEVNKQNGIIEEEEPENKPEENKVEQENKPEENTQEENEPEENKQQYP